MLIRIPTISSVGASNVLGILGVLGLVVSVGALAGNWWWSGLVGSVILIAAAYSSYLHEAKAAEAGQAQPGDAGVLDHPAAGPATARVAA